MGGPLRVPPSLPHPYIIVTFPGLFTLRSLANHTDGFITIHKNKIETKRTEYNHCFQANNDKLIMLTICPSHSRYPRRILRDTPGKTREKVEEGSSHFHILVTTDYSVFIPLDPGLDPRTQMNADPTDLDPDPHNWLYVTKCFYFNFANNFPV